MSAKSRLLAELRRQLRRRAHIDIINTLNTNTLSHLLEAVLHRYRIDVVLDVGANEGQFAAGLRETGYEGDIHSFEPVGTTFDRLQRAANADKSWHCHRMALGRSEGTLTVNISKSSVLSSALPVSAFGNRLFNNFDVIGQEIAPLGTIDGFMARTYGDKAVRVFLKCDTQGYDLEVFEGARGSLDRIHCLLSELSMLPLYEGMSRYPEVLARYEQAGFAASGFFPVNHTKDLEVVEVDCLMVKSGNRPHPSSTSPEP